MLSKLVKYDIKSLIRVFIPVWIRSCLESLQSFLWQ